MGEKEKGRNKVLILGGLVLLAIAIFALKLNSGTDGDSGGHLDLSGTYIAEGQEGMTMELKTDGTFSSTIKGPGVSMTIEGTYHQEETYVYFYIQGEPSGKAEIQDGTLINREEEITWIKKGWTAPTIQKPEVETPSSPPQELSPAETVELIWMAFMDGRYEEAGQYLSPEPTSSEIEILKKELEVEKIEKVEISSELIYEGQRRAGVDYKIIHKDGSEEEYTAYLRKIDDTWKIYQF